MRIYGVSRAYVYKMACKDTWGRYRHPDGTTRYRATSVDDTLSKGASSRNASRSGKVPT